MVRIVPLGTRRDNEGSESHPVGEQAGYLGSPRSKVWASDPFTARIQPGQPLSREEGRDAEQALP